MKHFVILQKVKTKGKRLKGDLEQHWGKIPGCFSFQVFFGIPWDILISCTLIRRKKLFEVCVTHIFQPYSLYGFMIFYMSSKSPGLHLDITHNELVPVSTVIHSVAVKASYR